MKRNFKRIFVLCTAFVFLFQNAVYAASLGAGGSENVFEAFEMYSDESASPSQAMRQSGFFKAGQESVLYLDKGSIEITNNEIRAYDTNGNPVTKTVNENTLVMLVTKEKAITQNFVSIKDSKVKLGIKDINFEGASFIRTEGECELSLFLYGENKLVNTNHDKALMHVNENSVFRLGGEGSLDFSAEHGPDGAFIGGDAGNKNGKIIIDSGKMEEKPIDERKLNSRWEYIGESERMVEELLAKRPNSVYEYNIEQIDKKQKNGELPGVLYGDLNDIWKRMPYNTP